MKMMIVILSTLICGVSAFARLGETPVECQQRYGKPIRIDRDEQKLYFNKDGIMLGCAFRDGKCWKIVYAKIAKDSLGRDEKFSDAEITVLLDSNGYKGDVFVAFLNVKETIPVTWERDGGLLTIAKTKESNQIAKERREKERAKEEETARSKLKGF